MKISCRKHCQIFNVSQINLSTVNISQDVLKLIPEAFAKSRGVILLNLIERKTRKIGDA